MNFDSTILSSSQLCSLRLLDSCIVADSIETFNERLRNEGFSDGSVRCLTPELGTMVGYAATVKIRGSAPPTAGGMYLDRTDWWEYILSLPTPRVLVVQDLETHTGLGSFLGSVQMHIIRALSCIGAITNGAVRDLPAAHSLGLHLFSESIAISHAYVHIIEFGTPVEISGLKINSGDLIHGDQHGFQTIPINHAGKIPAIAARLREKENTIINLCNSPEFSLEKLRFLIGN